MTQDTEALERQVHKLTQERDRLRRELDSAYDKIGHAGKQARNMRQDINRLSTEVRAMAAALTATANLPALPDDVRRQVVDALKGAHLE
jgi:chromosome segregation ATPase